MTALLVAMLLAQDGGVYPATRATLEVQGEAIPFGPLPDGGVVLVGLEPWKAVELANERQQKDFELEQRRRTGLAVGGVVLGILKAALEAVPIVISAVKP